MRINTAITGAEFEELVRPKLKLFLSVDVIGSTTFKQRSAAHIHEWLNAFINLYVSFPNTLAAAANQEQPGAAGSLRLWKLLGDELIFSAELRHRPQAALLLRALCKALRKTEADWQASGRPDHRQLALKGTAWLAGFPVGNAEIPLAGGATTSTGDPSDYVGPQMDTGFRLKEHSTPRKLILSAELALLLLEAGNHGLRLFFDGDQPLKGVLRGRPYPLTWVDCDGHDADPGGCRSDAPLNKLKDTLLHRAPAGEDTLRDYLHLWLQSTGGSLRAPFIHAQPFGLCQPAPGYEALLQKARADLRDCFPLQEEPEAPTATPHPLPTGLTEFLGEG